MSLRLNPNTKNPVGKVPFLVEEIKRQLHEGAEKSSATTSRPSKKGRDWEKWKAMFKQVGFCTASRYCLEPAGYDVLCPRHRAIKRQRDARYRARKVAARGWVWKRVPIERGGLVR